MKKLLLFVTLIVVAGLCFAQDGNGEAAPALPKPERFDLEISVGFPVHWTNAEHDGEFYPFFKAPGNPPIPPTTAPENQKMHLQLDKTVTADTAIGVALLWNFGRKTGFTLDYDFFYAARVAGFSSSSSDYNSMFGQNLLLGPVFFLYNSSFLRIPLAIGLHAYYFSDELWIPYLNPTNPASLDGFWLKRKEFQVGPGIYLGVQFHFNRNVYIFSRTNVSIDIFRWHQVKWIIDEGYAKDGTPTDVLIDETKTHTELSVSWGVKPTLGLGIKF